MNVDDMILVSIDDHVIEPRDMFDRHVPERWKDQAPRRCRRTTEGIERWVFQGDESGVEEPQRGGRVAQGGLGHGPHRPTPRCDPARTTSHERVRDMNRNGILASMCFPSFVGFSGGFFQRAADKDLALVMTQAYNDWHIDEWCASHPGRFIPLAIPPMWDPEALGRRDPPRRRQGLPRDDDARAPARPGPPELPRPRLLGSRFPGAVRRAGRDVPAHRPGLRGHQRRARRPDRQPDHPRHAGLDVRGAGPAVGSGVRAPIPTSRSRGRRPASGGSPSSSTAATATT